MAPPVPGSGNHSRWKCRLASVIAASKRMIGNWRATCRMVWITASRTSACRKSSCAVSFHGIAGAVVAVIDVARLAGPAVDALEHDRRVGAVVVVVLDLDRDAAVVGQVGPVEAIRRDTGSRAATGTSRGARSPSASRCPCGSAPCRSRAGCRAPRRARAGLRRRRVAAQVVGDVVVVERVGRGHRVGVAAELLDALRGAAALPQPDQPQRVEAAAREPGRAPRRESGRAA